LLDSRERARLATLTACAEDDIERILAAAAAEAIVLVLPSFSTVGEFRGWEAFAYDGGAKSAHLAEREAARALCGAPRPASAIHDVGARVRLCVGCEARVKALAERPERIAHYDRGTPSRPASSSPLPPLRRPDRAKTVASEQRPTARAGRPRSPAPPPAPPASGPPPAEPPPIEKPAPRAPSLFDFSIPTPRRPKRPF
jgi:hypothetical protein